MNASQRVLRYGALALLGLGWLCGAKAQTMTVGSPERIYTNYDTGTTSDFSRPSMKNPNNPAEVITWTSNGQYAFAKYSGPLDDPNRTRLWSGYSGRWNFTGFPSYYRPWLGNIYKHTDGTLIGFVHIETTHWQDLDCKYRQGIAISTNGGDNWRYCGDVIKHPRDAETTQRNLGGCAVVIVGDYFYQYFNEYDTDGTFRKPAVARALIADVVAAAKNFTVSPWVKYYNGSWNRNALTQAGSSVLPYPSDRYDAHGDAVYCAPLGKYLMVVYEQTGWDYSDPAFPKSDSRKGIYLYTSTDGVNWGSKQHVFNPLPGGDATYPFFAGIEGASDDNLTMGSSFYLFVHDRARHELYRIPITVSGGTATVATPTFSPPAGNYSSAQSVAISSATSGASIRYTLDGSTPSSTSGTLYNGPVNIASSATLKAIAYKSGMTNSGVAEGGYTIGAVELLANTGFETDLTGWSANGGSIARTTAQAHGGSASCRSYNRTAHWAGPRQSVKAAVLAAGPGDYAVSAWLRLASGSDTGRVEVGVKVGGQWTWGTVTGNVPTGGWGQVSGVIPVDWSGTVEDVWFAVNTGTSTAELFVDDCQFSRVLAAEPSPPENTGPITNGGFEDGWEGWTVAASDGGTPACSVLGTQGQTEGSFALALGNANAAGNAVVSQTVATEPGTLTALHFDYGAFGSANRRQRVFVEVLDGEAVLAEAVVTALGPGNFLPQNATFAGRMLLFEAASEATTVRFTDQTTLDDSNGCDGMLDRVRIETPEAALSARRQAYLEWAFGLFLHYNMGTYTGQEWASPNQPLDTFAPTALDTDQWADAAKAAGMRYGILTAKHHDGFALWDTGQSDYDVAGTSWFAAQPSGQGDIVKRFVDSFRSRGLQVGLYYSIWDRSNGIDGSTLTGRQATDYVKAELTELLSRYGAIDVIWTDGWGWKDWHGYVRFDEVYAHVKALSPDTLVVDNNHTAVNSDLRTYEQSPFPPAGNAYPSEVCATLRADGKWFWSTGASELKSAEYVVDARETTCARRAAFLLNMPPDRRGLIPEGQTAVMVQARADWLASLAITGFRYDAVTGRGRLQSRGRAYETYRARASVSPRFDGEVRDLEMLPADAAGSAATLAADGFSVMADATGTMDVSFELGEAAAQFFRFEHVTP